jgi:hypothetical protein
VPLPYCRVLARAGSSWRVLGRPTQPARSSTALGRAIGTTCALVAIVIAWSARAPKTTVALTHHGRAALDSYTRALRDLLGGL